jgi:hypothetical protein
MIQKVVVKENDFSGALLRERFFVLITLALCYEVPL